ncbi:helix-turn-helix transcriptional regulator [Pyxidicoccus xibeiensis]|uniref:helix-turn-helix transcriptional regulator n=1 Tax=Pyxidicoccus xibeiensis TaxID=2906759 RepID=UPI0020A80FD0|nr:YafY family protein [Pyxidicoccus xibeiensis]MCP3138023.1 YafY family transcriptional regulator [Pyxidicoccus xibeiensis]
MRRADRLFQVVQLMQRQRLVKAAQLARKLGVSERTVYRDVSDLARSGVPIHGEAGVGYTLDRGYTMPPLAFSEEELEALVLGARMVQAGADPALARAADSALTKIAAALPISRRDELAAPALMVPLGGSDARRPGAPGPTRAEGLPRGCPTAGPDVRAPALHGLRRAVRERRKVRFRYDSLDGETSLRTVWPLGLTFWGRVWSLAAWCELRDDFRTFRVDRVDGLETLDEPYPLVAGRTLEDFLRLVRASVAGDAPAATPRPSRATAV